MRRLHPACMSFQAVWVRPSQSGVSSVLRPGYLSKTYPDALLQQADEVLGVGGVVRVADVNAVEVNALFLEDGYLLFADALGRPGVGGDGDAGGLLGAGGGAQDYLAFVGYAAHVVGDLDDAGLDAGVLDALFYLADVERGYHVGRGCPEDAGNVAPGAGGADDVDAGLAGDLFEQADVASEVKGGYVYDGAEGPLSRRYCRSAIPRLMEPARSMNSG